MLLSRKRDQLKCYDQVKITRKRDRETGLNSLEYDSPKIHQLTIDDIPFMVLNVNLNCDKSLTPWCDCEGAAVSNCTVAKGFRILEILHQASYKTYKTSF